MLLRQSEFMPIFFAYLKIGNLFYLAEAPTEVTPIFCSFSLWTRKASFWVSYYRNDLAQEGQGQASPEAELAESVLPFRLPRPAGEQPLTPDAQYTVSPSPSVRWLVQSLPAYKHRIADCTPRGCSKVDGG